MRKNSALTSVMDLSHGSAPINQKIPVGKSQKLVWASQPYQYALDLMPDLVGRDKEMRLITAAWIGRQCTAPLSPLLVGAPGVGKNRLVYEMSRRFGRPLFIMQGHEDVTADDMACAVRFDDNDSRRMEYTISPVASAMVHGGICFIDEIGKIRPRALALLASVLDDRRYIDSILLGERIHAAPGFRFIAATNTGEINLLPDFIRSRLWPVITVGYPQKEEVKQIVGQQFPDEHGQIEELLDVFWALWEKHHNDGKNAATPRDVIKLFTLASNFCELKNESVDVGFQGRERGVAGKESANALGLQPEHLERAFEHLFGEEAS